MKLWNNKFWLCIIIIWNLSFTQRSVWTNRSW